jgi:hypothetical protein
MRRASHANLIAVGLLLADHPSYSFCNRLHHTGEAQKSAGHISRVRRRSKQFTADAIRLEANGHLFLKGYSLAQVIIVG